MISKKARRSTRPVEYLEQFEISARKGIDITTTADKLETVQDIENFDVSLSGDLELRKPILRQPIVTLPGLTVRKILPLYDPDYRLYIVSPNDNSDVYRVRIVKVSTGTPCNITYEWSNYYTNEEYLSAHSAFEATAGITNPIDWRYLNLSHVSTSSIGTNAKVDLHSDVFKVGNQIVIHDTDLIPDPALVYRDIQFTKDRESDTWRIKIVMPYMNTFSAETGTFDANYALDNPYAARDDYSGNVLAVKNVRAYIKCAPDTLGNLVSSNLTVNHDSFTVADDPDMQVVTTTGNTSQQYTLIRNQNNDSVAHGQLTCTAVTTTEALATVSLSLSRTVNTAYNVYFTGQVKLFYTGSQGFTELTRGANDHYQGVYTYGTHDIFSTWKFLQFSSATDTFDVTIPITAKDKPLKLQFDGTFYVFDSSANTDLTVAQLTESTCAERYYPISMFSGSGRSEVYLKAFCTFSSWVAGEDAVYCCWEKTYDGKTWEHILQPYEPVEVQELATQYDSSGNVTDPDPSITVNTPMYNFPVTPSPKDRVNDSIYERTDVCRVAMHVLKGAQIRFRVVAVDPTTFKVRYALAEAQLFPIWGPELELSHSDLPNATSGKSLAHNSVVYTYGTPSVQPIVYASNAGEFIRPESKIIDIAVSAADAVNTLIPWRNYLIAATDSSIHLITKTDSGYYTKTINSNIGIPKPDSRCAVAVLNGIIFKSGGRIFQLYPNLYSGDDTILNISDISKPIASEVFDSEQAFAFSTEEAYYLFLPTSTNTVCLKYNYSLRVWTKFTYPVELESYRIYSTNNIRVFGTGAAFSGESVTSIYGEFQIESPLNEHLIEVSEAVRGNLLYGDYVLAPLSTVDATGIGEDVVSPIYYMLDTGQKIDKLVYTKQFTEAKFVFNTLSTKDKFPCSVQVQIDGDPRVHTINVSSDSPFWSSADRFQNSNNTDNPIVTLNVNSYSSESDLLNTFKQLIIRYSGKGRSVRFVLSGTSTYPFKLHNILSRYRTLNVKQ